MSFSLIIWSAVQSRLIYLFIVQIWLNIQINCICFLDNEWHHSELHAVCKTIANFHWEGVIEVKLPTLNISDSTKFSKIHPFTNA